MSEDNKDLEFINPQASEAPPVDDIPEFDELPDMAQAAEAAEKYGVIEDSKPGKTSLKVAVLGLGQCGSNMADQFFKMGYERVLAVNTAEQDMKSLTLKKDNQFVMQGYNGAGKNPAVGAEAAKKYSEEILNKMHQCFGKSVDHVFICASGAGGTGAGGLCVGVEIAEKFFQEQGKEAKIGVILAMPDKTEKGASIQNSDILYKKVLALVDEKKVSPFIVVDNAQISKFFPNVSIMSFYPQANKIVCGIFDRFNTITAYASPIGHNVDATDFKTALSGGVMTYGQCKINGNNIAEGITKNVKNTLLAQGFDVSQASHAVCLILAGSGDLESITKDSVDKAMESMTRVFSNPEVKIHLGIYKAPHPGVSVYTMVSGLKKI